MSSTQLSLQIRLDIGGVTVPLATAINAGTSLPAGTTRGVFITLDQQPGDPPVTVKLGGIVDFIESKLGLGAGSVSGDPGASGVAQALPSGVAFTADNAAQIDVRKFVMNVTSSGVLFAISADVHGADPTKGFVPLPAELASWLSIDSLAVSFTAASKSA